MGRTPTHSRLRPRKPANPQTVRACSTLRRRRYHVPPSPAYTLQKRHGPPRRMGRDSDWNLRQGPPGPPPGASAEGAWAGAGSVVAGGVVDGAASRVSIRSGVITLLLRVGSRRDSPSTPTICPILDSTFNFS